MEWREVLDTWLGTMKQHRLFIYSITVCGILVYSKVGYKAQQRTERFATGGKGRQVILFVPTRANILVSTPVNSSTQIQNTFDRRHYLNTGRSKTQPLTYKHGKNALEGTGGANDWGIVTYPTRTMQTFSDNESVPSWLRYKAGFLYIILIPGSQALYKKIKKHTTCRAPQGIIQ